MEICGFDVMIFAEASLSSRSAVWRVHNPHIYNGPEDLTCEPEGSMYDKLGHTDISGCTVSVDLRYNVHILYS